MARPYGLLRAGFPYIKSIGWFRKTDFPLDLAFGKEGMIYVLCHWNRDANDFKQGPLVMLNLEDEDLGCFHLPDGGLKSMLPPEDGKLMNPMQLVLDSNENLYISDQGCHRITILTKEGEFVGNWGEYGDLAGQLDRPSGIAFDADENLHVVDTMNHRIQKFKKDGTFLSQWGTFGSGEGQFNMPWGIAIDELGYIYIADWRNDRIQKFTEDGEFVFEFGRSGNGDGEFLRPAGIAVDADGDIYVVDSENDRVQLFAPDGHFVQKFLGDATLSKTTLERMWTRPGKFRRVREMASLDQEKRFSNIKSVRIDSEGRMFVPDFEHYRIQVYQKEAYPLDENELIAPLRSPTLDHN